MKIGKDWWKRILIVGAIATGLVLASAAQWAVATWWPRPKIFYASSEEVEGANGVWIGTDGVRRFHLEQREAVNVYGILAAGTLASPSAGPHRGRFWLHFRGKSDVPVEVGLGDVVTVGGVGVRAETGILLTMLAQSRAKDAAMMKMWG